MAKIEVVFNLFREKKSPYVPDVNNSWDTQNFDHYDEEEPWYPSEQKSQQKAKKKNPEFIGYTYKPMEEPNSALIKALVDLEHYKIPDFSQKNLDYLQLEQNNSNSYGNDTRFKKASDKTERMNKEIYMTTTVAMTAKRNEEKEKERYKFLYGAYGDTPEKKPSPSHRFVKKSPKQTIKLSPASKVWDEKKMKMKVVQKKLI